MAGVELAHITKTYSGGVRAVDDLSLTIADHQFLVLVGPSGCGKSTTLRLIAGLEEADRGTIRIGERDVTTVPPRDRDIAMVFQNYALYPHMTVYRNLSFGLRLRKMPSLLSRLRSPSRARQIKREIHQRVHRVAEMLDIQSLLERKPRELSGGQRQRVAVGRAIVRDPAAFLFDEPLSNLDARLRLTTRAELKRLHQQLRTTTVYVTHDQEEAMTLGDRIVVMKDGRIQQDGTPMELYHRPVNRFVAGFIGMPPMNFFEGLLREHDGSLVFEQSLAPAPAHDIAHSPGRDQTPDDDPKVKPPAWGFSTAAEADGLTNSHKPFNLTIPARLAPTRMSAVGATSAVVLGIRPEHLSLKPIRADDGSIVSQPLQLRLNLIEPIGSSVDLYLQSSGREQIVARVDAGGGNAVSDLRVGSPVEVHLDLRRAHLFEPGDTGMNLSLETIRSGQPTELAHANA
jgi:multiple sugar transport system ATP-binding protein